MVKKSPEAYRNIREASELLALEPHVLRFWESRFDEIQPMTRGGGRRFYSPDDLELLRTIKTLLHERGVTIKAAIRLISKHGTDAVNKLSANDARRDENRGKNRDEKTAPESTSKTIADQPQSNGEIIWANDVKRLNEIDALLAGLTQKATNALDQLDEIISRRKAL